MAQFDNIGPLFDGGTTTFSLTVSGSPVVFPINRDLDVSVGGVALYEGTGYTISGTNIIFTTPPQTGDLFVGEIIDLDVQYTNILNAPQIANGETNAVTNQTLFTLTGVNGTPYNTHIHLNGVKLATTDYSSQYVGALNQLNITLATACVAGDVLSISTSHQGGSSACITSGEVVGTNIVLNKADGTQVLIDITTLL